MRSLNESPNQAADIIDIQKYIKKSFYDHSRLEQWEVEYLERMTRPKCSCQSVQERMDSLTFAQSVVLIDILRKAEVGD